MNETQRKKTMLFQHFLEETFPGTVSDARTESITLLIKAIDAENPNNEGRENDLKAIVKTFKNQDVSIDVLIDLAREGSNTANEAIVRLYKIEKGCHSIISAIEDFKREQNTILLIKFLDSKKISSEEKGKKLDEVIENVKNKGVPIKILVDLAKEGSNTSNEAIVRLAYENDTAPTIIGPIYNYLEWLDTNEKPSYNRLNIDDRENYHFFYQLKKYCEGIINYFTLKNIDGSRGFGATEEIPAETTSQNFSSYNIQPLEAGHNLYFENSHSIPTGRLTVVGASALL